MKMNMHGRGFVLRGICASLLVVALLSGCEKPSSAGQDAAGGGGAPPAIPVTVTPAEAQAVPVYLDQIGRISAVEAVILKPRVNGPITDVKFTEGANVHKGDALFLIDSKPYEVAFARADAAHLQAQEALRLSEMEFKRVESLKGTNVVSEQEYDTRRMNVAVSQAQVKAAKASVDAARLDLEYCKITSPIDGRTGQRMVDVGNIVKDSETQLVSIQNLKNVNVDFTVAEKELPAIREKMKASGLVVEIATPDSAANGSPTTRPAAKRSGQLVFLDNEVKPGSGTIKLRAVVNNEDELFWPGQFVTVRLILQTLDQAVMIPQRAVQIGQQGPYVFIVDSSSISKMRPIQLGQRHGDHVVALSGLQPGEKVVDRENLMLRPDASVMILNAAPTTAPAASQK